VYGVVQLIVDIGLQSRYAVEEFLMNLATEIHQTVSKDTLLQVKFLQFQLLSNKALSESNG